VDDILVYCMGEDDYVLVVNAANVSKDFQWVSENAPPGLNVVNDSDKTAQIAIQGPSAARLASAVLGEGIAELKRFTSTVFDFHGECAVVSRTGYTGEDGFEVYLNPSLAGDLWDSLMEGDGSAAPQPVGLGARDTLRFEASFRLYGNDIDETTDPLEAGLGWTVKPDKGGFIGRDALVKRREDGLSRKFVGIELSARRIARKGCPLLVDGERAGVVTSGAFAPYLEKSLAMGYLDAGVASPGTAVGVDIKGRTLDATVVKIPFLKAS
jgi:aminomethyltransferase